ncbi:hypothetical protein [Deinococcus alpinitundrae]|uniref:hypothetical protein n=1 Tax=Deinococcus alpinitundrae TaxID=468913 RepID=UPI00137A8E56|nr:hypothetical protein [Deinococcus alpinitundrae]
MTNAPSHTSPATLPPVLPRQQAYDLIRSGKINEALEPARALQAAFERGEIDDRGLKIALSVFSSYRPELTAQIVENAETRSGDYLSLLAAGLHYTGLVWLKRTFRLGRDIPEANRTLMVDAAQKADIYLSRALHATAQPSVAYSQKQLTAMTFGQDPWDLYAEGLRRCPNSMLIREGLLLALRAEWGGQGDYSSMRAVLTRPENRDLPAEQQRHLAALELGYEAHHHLHFKDDKDGAYRLYQESLTIMPTIHVLTAMIDAPDTDNAMAEGYLEQVLELDPNNDHARARLGVRHGLRGRSAYGLKLLRDAWTWGDPYASDVHNTFTHHLMLGRMVFRLGF